MGNLRSVVVSLAFLLFPVPDCLAQAAVDPVLPVTPGLPSWDLDPLRQQIGKAPAWT